MPAPDGGASCRSAAVGPLDVLVGISACAGVRVSASHGPGTTVHAARRSLLSEHAVAVLKDDDVIRTLDEQHIHEMRVLA